MNGKEWRHEEMEGGRRKQSMGEAKGGKAALHIAVTCLDLKFGVCGVEAVVRH